MASAATVKQVPVTQFLGLAVTVGLGAFIATQYDVPRALGAALHISPIALVVVVAALTGGLLLSTVRFVLVMRALELPVPSGLAFRANTFGILGGLAFFAVIGQALARTVVLSRYGYGGPAVLLASFYERIGALASLASMALLAAIYLHGRIAFAVTDAANHLIKMVGVLVVCALLVVWLVPDLWPRCPWRIKANLIIGASGVAACSLLMHLTTLAAFVLLASSFAPGIALDQLIAASLIVMFAASLPFSFAGWGLRELSAIYTFGLIGMDAEHALATSVIIGLVSLVVVLAMAAGASLTGTSLADRKPARDAATMQQRSLDITRFLAWLIPPAVGVVIFFQVRVPMISGDAVTINLADPLAIAAGLVLVALLGRTLADPDLWRPKHLVLGLAATTLVIAVGFGLGWSRHGLTDWALYSRFWGWFILLGYFAAGALASAADGERGASRVFDVLLVTGVSIAAIDLALLTAFIAGLDVAAWGVVPKLRGMVANSNAFALQLMSVLAIIGAGSAFARASRRRPSLIAGALAIVLAALYATSSRSAYGTLLVVLAATLLFGWASRRTVVRGIIGGVAIVLVLVAIGPIAHAVSSSFGATAGLGGGNPSLLLYPKLTRAASDHQRWVTIAEGLKLWLAYPVFGAGLGAALIEIKARLGTGLVIHNSAVWLLAEFGLVGFHIIAGLFVAIAMTVWRDARAGDVGACVLVLFLIAAAMFSLVHEVFYQRIIWFMAGVVLFRGRASRPATEHR